jgi:hypothetical protein
MLCAGPPKTVAMAHANADIGAMEWPVHGRREWLRSREGGELERAKRRAVALLAELRNPAPVVATGE